MQIKAYHWSLRSISIILVGFQVLGPLNNFLWAKVEDLNFQRTPTRSESRRGTSSFTPTDVTLHFSDQPTEAEIFAAPVFGQALVPIGNSTPKENKELANVLVAYVKRKNIEEQSVLLDFLQKYPASAWKASLLLNLGIDSCRTGRFSDAIAAWEEAWNLSKMATDTKAKAMADTILGELVQIHDWVGDYEKIEPLLVEVKDRELIGGATERVSSARRGLWAVKNQTADFKCGPYALQQLMASTHSGSNLHKLFENGTFRKGASLAQLRQQALQLGLKYRVAKREKGAVIPPNCVVHWKLNHYSAIQGKKGEQYQVLDPAFNRTFGHDLFVTMAVLDEQSDGYFLIPEGPLPAGWQSVEEKEAQAVTGRGEAFPKDSAAYTPGDPLTCPITPAPGMAAASAHLMLVSVHIVDIPIRYDPPIGPSVEFRVTYNQKDNRTENNPTYSNIGSKWTFDWFSYVTDNGVGQPQSETTRYVVGGGQITHSGYNPSTGSYAPDLDGGLLHYDGANTYILTFPDGSQQVFGQPSAPSGARKLFLTQIIDKAGNALSIHYDDQLRISCITDAINQTTVLHYDRPSNSKLITSIEDPFQRTAFLDYDASDRLIKITDSIGMTSQFTYDGAGTFINKMTTPYGDTSFTYYDFDDATAKNVQILLIKNPAGSMECLMSETISGLGTSDTDSQQLTVDGWDGPNHNGTFVNLNLQYRNTFYYSKKAMSQIDAQNSLGLTPIGPLQNLTPSAMRVVLESFLNRDDYLGRPTVYHWLHHPPSGHPIVSRIIESVQPPLEGRIWYWYPGQDSAQFDSSIQFRTPSIIARVVEDPSGGSARVSQAYQFTYNDLGKITVFKDPKGRQTEFEYYNNNLDLHKVWQKGATGNELISEFGAYNIIHLPSSYTVASRKTYNFSWNSDGQLLEVTNPKNERFQIEYDANGFAKAVNRLWSGPNKTTLLSYDPCGRIRTFTDSENYAVTYDYDNLDRVTKVTYPDQTFEKYEYSRLDLIRAWDRSGHRINVTYDALGHPTKVTDRLNRTTQYTWCDCGSLESITDPLTHTTTWYRDVQGRITDKYYANSTTRHYHYDYEKLSGRLKSTTDPKGQDKTYTYFVDNTLKNISYSPSTTPSVSFTYDPNYRRVATMSDGSGSTSFGYVPITADGNLGAMRLAFVDGPLGNDTITYSYDELGRLINSSINGVSESLQYDGLGRIVMHTTPLGTSYPTYVDETRRLSAFAYPNGQNTRFDYMNNLGDQRLNRIWNTTASSATLSRDDYQYDVLGRKTQWTRQVDSDVFQTKQLEYDFEGQLINAEITQKRVGTTAYTYGYDPMGNRTSEQVDLPGANPVSTVTYSTYNSANQLTARSGNGAVPVRVKGTIDAPWTLVTQGAVTMADVDGWFMSMGWYEGFYGNYDNRTKSLTESATVTVNNQPAIVVTNKAQGYGGKTFSATVNLPPGNNTVQVRSTDYRPWGGNYGAKRSYIVTVNGGTSKSYAYDDNGNTTTAGTTTYQWDAQDRLVKIINGTSQSEFSYDGFGRRVKVVEKNNGLVSTRFYVWSGTTLREERDVTGLKVLKRFYAEGEQMGDGTTYANYYFTRDHLGSVREMTDSQGILRARYDYEPYGRRSANLVTGANALEADFGFTGHYFHAPSGLHLSLYRAYDADAGRWINRDPIEEAGGLNLYGYVRNNPIRYIDPYGLDLDSAGMGDGLAEVGGLMLRGLGAAATGLGRFVDWAGDKIGIPNASEAAMFLPELGLMGELGKLGEEANELEKGLHRPYLRNCVVDEIKASAPRAPDGRFIDPNTLLPTDNPVIGHKPGYEFWRLKQAAEAEGVSQKLFNETLNNAEFYQIEDYLMNASHRFEQK